jgi:hypothetical protein
MMRRPCASSRAAAAITSITMNGGTAPRADGRNLLLAFSSMKIRLYVPGVDRRDAAPVLPYSPAFVILGCATLDAPAVS